MRQRQKSKIEPSTHESHLGHSVFHVQFDLSAERGVDGHAETDSSSDLHESKEDAEFGVDLGGQVGLDFIFNRKLQEMRF